MRLIHHAINTCRLEKNARLLTKNLFTVAQLGQVDVDRTDLSARDRKIGWIFVQAERLAPPAFSGLRNVAHDARHLRIFKHADAHLVVGRKGVKRGANAAQVRGVRGMNGCKGQYGHAKKPLHWSSPHRLRQPAVTISSPTFGPEGAPG